MEVKKNFYRAVTIFFYIFAAEYNTICLPKMTEKQRIEKITEWFRIKVPVAETELEFKNPFQLLVAVILSAQCTDKRVNIITKKLFDIMPDCQSVAQSSVEEIYELIKSCSYPNNKSKHIYNMSQMLLSEFQGQVPSDVEELQRLPGVGRKTANVVISVVYQKPAMAVDTHVFRVSKRLGLTQNAKNPLQAEKQLVKLFKESEIHKAHHWLILHGRYVCVARKPKCGECGLKEWCPAYSDL